LTSKKSTNATGTTGTANPTTPVNAPSTPNPANSTPKSPKKPPRKNKGRARALRGPPFAIFCSRSAKVNSPKCTNEKTKPKDPISVLENWQPSPEQIQRHHQRKTNLSAAASAPLPGPLREAFANLPTLLLGVNLLPVTAGHIAILEAINARFLTAIQLAAKVLRCEEPRLKKQLTKQAQKYILTIPDIALALFVFSNTPRELWANLSKNPKAIQAAALDFLETLPPVPSWNDVQTALAAHYSKSFLTAIEYDRRGDGEGFPSPRSKTTASAGS
jgi:hypothetical protein